MISGYTKNLSVQILISLLKQHNIKKIVISPGTTNLEFTAAVQYEGSFQLFSSVDERSAAYMACGIAAEFSEPVAIVCTESTASRNYFSGLTEAYYRKLPVLAITGVHDYSKVGHLYPQTIDRSVSPNDLVKYKAQLPIIKNDKDIKVTEVLINSALLELTRNGGGPVHIDLPCCNDDYDFSIKELYQARKIDRLTYGDDFPSLPDGKIAIYVGSHIHFSDEEIEMINKFASSNDAVIFCDHSSDMRGKYSFNAGILAIQANDYEIFKSIELLIHIGEGIADEPTVGKLKRAKTVWRVNPDGEIRDFFGKLEIVFQMSEHDFFKEYIKKDTIKDSYINNCNSMKETIDIPHEELPLSNVYAASRISGKFPHNSRIHLGVSNTIRAWSLFDFPESVRSFSNVGCRGIDGGMSALVGSSLIDVNTIYFGVFGDLSFFYDMNCLGNRDIKSNVRILLINNNGGGVFKLEGAPGYRYFGEETTNEFIAASGHFGNKSSVLVKNYVEALGFEYISATDKKEFDDKYEYFVSEMKLEKPLLFEVFTKDEDERTAFNIMRKIDTSTSSHVKDVAKQILGEKGIKFVKKVISK